VSTLEWRRQQPRARIERVPVWLKAGTFAMVAADLAGFVYDGDWRALVIAFAVGHWASRHVLD